jgi:hypothetical protein
VSAHRPVLAIVHKVSVRKAVPVIVHKVSVRKAVPVIVLRVSVRRIVRAHSRISLPIKGRALPFVVV